MRRCIYTVPFKLYACAAVVLVLGLLLWHDHHETHRANAAVAAQREAVASLTALQTAYAHERAIATEASNDYERRLQALQVSAADTPVRAVRLCRSPTGYVPAPSATASGVDAAGDAGHSSAARQDIEVSRDLGPDLYALADEKDKQLAQCASLMGWVPTR